MNQNPDSIAYRRFITWVEQSVENENFVNFEIDVVGKPEKGEGFLGEIVFIEVKGTCKGECDKCLHLVVKHGKDNASLRKVSAMKTAFMKEIFLYDKVFPAFTKFQLEKKLAHPFDCTPKCYKTFVLENLEVLILENLKKSGYVLRDSKRPLDVIHLKRILKEYGKFHALSFALRDQKQEEFDKLLDGKDMFKEVFSRQKENSLFRESVEDALKILEENQQFELVTKLKSIVVNGTQGVFYKLVAAEEQQSVIIHGDGWNNNFLFKYEDGDKTTPTQVKILDWQISAVRSPVFDLSYLIYANSSQTELDRFDELLETYYSSFSSFLKELGSNPEELFTFSDLKRHWKKYSLFGVLFMPTLLKFVLCKKEDAPALEDYKEGDQLGKMMSPDIGDIDAYYSRLKAVCSHYFSVVESD